MQVRDSPSYRIGARLESPNRPLHVSQFVQRFPPALGGSEAYVARLCAHLAGRGDAVSVWTSSAIELSEMWGQPTPSPQGVGEVVLPSPLAGEGAGASPAGEGALSTARPRSTSDPSRVPLTRLEDSPPSPARGEGRTTSPTPCGAGGGLTRYTPLHLPARRYVLKALSLLPSRNWQCLTSPCNPVCPQMWRDAGAYDGPLDAVLASAFPYSFPIACGLRLARRRGVPFLLTPFLHLGDPTDAQDRTRKQYTKPHLRWLLRQADRVFVQTRAERDAVVSLGVAEQKVILQGLGVEPSECTGGDRDSARVAWGIRDEVVVGHLANNSAEKGTVDLLRAAERLWARGERFRVVLAGPEMPNFRTFWERFGPKERVTRLGVLSEIQKRDFFAGIDAFALPSRSDSFGLVLLEAWANAKPNLVYRAGGPAELVRDGIDGLQAACGDVGELAAQLGRLVTDPELRREFGNRGRSRVGREFRWEDKLELVRATICGAVRRAGEPGA